MKIESLTPEQEVKLAEYREKWLAIGLDTKRANRSVAEKAARDAYKEAGLAEPKIFIWLDSPQAGLIGAKLIKEAAKNSDVFKVKDVEPQVRDQVGGQVWDQVGDQVWDQVRGQVWDQVRGQVGDQVRGQVWGQVGDQVRGQVWDQVRGQVGDQVWDQVWDQVGDQVRDQVGDQVRDQVGDQVWDQVRGQVWDQVRDQESLKDLRQEWQELGFWGCHNAGWLSYYSYFLEVCGLECCKRLIPLMTMAQEVGWTWLYENVVIFTEKPTELSRNDRHQLHCDGGPAVKYADGYSVYAYNGMRVPEKIVMTPKEEITKDMILKEENVDYRRVLVSRIGIEKAIEVLGAEVVDTYESKVGGKYELLMIDYDGRGTKRPYLKMRSKSIDAYHIEGVDPNVRTVKDAIMFRNKLKKFIEPDVLS